MAEGGLQVEWKDAETRPGLPKDGRPPEQSKKYRAFRAATFGLKLLQVYVLAMVFAFGDRAVTWQVLALELMLMATDAYVTIGYINGQAALDRYSDVLRFALAKGAEVRTGDKGEPVLTEDPEG